jgi:hypothetical protein
MRVPSPPWTLRRGRPVPQPRRRSTRHGWWPDRW